MTECTKQLRCVMCIQGFPCEAARSEAQATQREAEGRSHPEILALIEAAEGLHDAVERAALAHEVQDEYDALSQALQEIRSGK